MLSDDVVSPSTADLLKRVQVLESQCARLEAALHRMATYQGVAHLLTPEGDS